MRAIFGERPEVSVQLVSGTLWPGQEVRGVIRLSTSTARQIQGGYVYLRCQEQFTFRVRRRTRRGTTTTATRGEEDIVKLEQTFLPSTTLVPGAEQQYAFSFVIPQAAPPTYEGDILKVEWWVEAKLDLRRAFDARGRADLVVCLPAQGPYPQGRHEADSAQHSECGISIVLTGTAYRAGGPVEGTVRIDPQEAFQAQELRVELRREEFVPMREGNTHSELVAETRLAPETALTVGVPWVLPFRLDIPPEPRPSVSTRHGAALWELDVIVARRLRGDLHLRKGIHVYTFPEDPQ